MSPCLCIYVHVSMSMSPCPCFHVSMSMSPGLYVPISPCFHVSCLYRNVSMSKSQCLHFSMSPCLHVSMSPCPCLMFSKFRERKTELTKNGNFRLFAANGKWKGQTSVCLPQTEMEVCFPWWANDKR
jgi:hypothetical protein